jgi:hypothetical protein
VERDEVIPSRSADSLRNFFKVNSKIGLEGFLKKAIEKNTRYCHAFSSMPKELSKMNQNKVEEIEFIETAKSNKEIIYEEASPIMQK